MVSSQEGETDRYPRRTGVVATGVVTIIDIVKSAADRPAREDGYQLPPPADRATNHSRSRRAQNITGTMHLIA